MNLPVRPLFTLFVLLLVPAAAVASQPPAQRSGDNQAALVIRSGDEQVESYCVAFSEPEISGYELLLRAGRDVAIGDSGLGVTVCQLDGVGCPAGNCFCQCKGDPCVYWSYWHRRQGEWQYAAVGASAYMVQPGDVEGWSWGPGSVTEAIAPPPLSFADVCAEGETPADNDSVALAADAPTPTESISSSAAPTPSVAQVPAQADVPESGVWLYGLFAVIVLGLGAFLWWLRRETGS